MPFKDALVNVAKLSTVTQILLFLPLTLSTLSTTAFLSLSLLLFIHSIIHGSLILIFGSGILSVLQVPMHPFLLLLCFNLFSQSSSLTLLSTIAHYWGALLKLLTPFFITFEAVASLLLAQTLGQQGKKMADISETWQFTLLITSAISYVAASWWIIVAYPAAAQSPLSSTLLGATLTAFLFLTFIGFSLRRTNVIESSCLFLYLAFNIWLSGFGQTSQLEPNAPFGPLLDNLHTHFKSLAFFVTNTLPKPILLSLTYRLLVLHLSSRVLPTIGADAWDGAEDDEDRPTSRLNHILLTYRQAIFVTTYTHLLLLEPSSQVWWRHATMVICLIVWTVELLITGGDDDEIPKVWKVD